MVKKRTYIERNEKFDYIENSFVDFRINPTKYLIFSTFMNKINNIYNYRSLIIYKYQFDRHGIIVGF